jgi:hypothetical protein
VKPQSPLNRTDVGKPGRSYCVIRTFTDTFNLTEAQLEVQASFAECASSVASAGAFVSSFHAPPPAVKSTRFREMNAKKCANRPFQGGVEINEE